ncbi:MAG: hypothetical protein ACRC9L_02035 [Brevinema sp.]
MFKITILKTGSYYSTQGREIVISDQTLADIAHNSNIADAPVRGLDHDCVPVAILASKGKLEIELPEDLKDKNLQACLVNISDNAHAYRLQHIDALDHDSPRLLINIQEALGWKHISFSIAGEEGVFLPFKKNSSPSSPSNHELLTRLAQAEKECRQLREELARTCVDGEILEWECWKEFPKAMQERVRAFALKEIEAGKDPKVAVASFAEHLPDKKRSRFGTPAFTNSPEILGKEFALKKAEYESQGFSPSVAYDKAQKDLQGECL